MQDISDKLLRINFTFLFDQFECMDKLIDIHMRFLIGGEFVDHGSLSITNFLQDHKLPTKTHPFVHRHKLGTLGNIIKCSMCTS